MAHPSWGNGPALLRVLALLLCCYHLHTTAGTHCVETRGGSLEGGACSLRQVSEPFECVLPMQESYRGQPTTSASGLGFSLALHQHTYTLC